MTRSRVEPFRGLLYPRDPSIPSKKVVWGVLRRLNTFSVSVVGSLGLVYVFARLLNPHTHNHMF